MSDFFDKAKEVTKDVCNSAKLHAQILSHEAKIRELYYKLGRDYYNAIENNIDDVSSLENICEEIKTRFEKISALKKTLESVIELYINSCPGGRGQIKKIGGK